jgi:hypothetical protein
MQKHFGRLQAFDRSKELPQSRIALPLTAIGMAMWFLHSTDRNSHFAGEQDNNVQSVTHTCCTLLDIRQS